MQNLFETVELCRGAERTDEILNRLALVLVVQLFGGGADDLEDDADGARGLVGPGDCERYAFAVIVDPEYDELTGLCLSRDERGFYVHERDRRVERFFVNYPVHILSFVYESPRCGELFAANNIIAY